MRFFTQIALLGSTTVALVAATAASNGTTNPGPFRLGAVDLTTNKVTPVTIGQTEASIHILQAATNATGAQFEYHAATHQLWNQEYGFSDASRPNVTVTFGEFSPPVDGFLVQKSGDDGVTYIVNSADAGGRADGWSLCGTIGIYWLGEQDAPANCTNVALEIQ
ncbi:hypothetical protein HD806DRAFT_76218 [Xylariaceae sp. AK1471]|nr:hypothetical protein HD806DRAFT_76218 [Xylariaceae sp. AK1471]